MDPLADLNILRTPPPNSKRSKGYEVIRWIETHCVYTSAQWIGKPARLMAWQKLFILNLFAVDEADKRIYRWALLGVPKKSGKTELAAWLALYFLVGSGEPSPLVVCAAASEEQADLVFGAAKRCAEMSPTLKLICHTWDKEITVPTIPGAKLRRLAAAKGNLDGLNIYVAILDELHQWESPKSRDTWTVITNGVGARREPLILQITTAGHDLDTICGEQYEFGKRLIAEPDLDPRYLFWWFEAHETADWQDPATWRSATPSWGVTLPDPEVYLSDQLTKKRESEFRRFFLNQWTEAADIWLPAEAWELTVDEELGLDPALPTFVAVDVGLKHDSSGVAVVQVQEKRTVARVRIWSNPYPKDHSLYESWRLDIVVVENYLRELREQFPTPTVTIDNALLPGPGFFYDPHFFERSAQMLEGEGFAMVEFPQTDSRMVPASTLLYELFTTGELAHDGDPDLRRHVYSAIAKETERGWRLSKPRGSRKRIDGCIALAIAAYNAHQQPEEPEVPPTPQFLVLD